MFSVVVQLLDIDNSWPHQFVYSMPRHIQLIYLKLSESSYFAHILLCFNYIVNMLHNLQDENGSLKYSIIQSRFFSLSQYSN